VAGSAAAVPRGCGGVLSVPPGPFASFVTAPAFVDGGGRAPVFPAALPSCLPGDGLTGPLCDWTGGRGFRARP
jgi:hypothetical protein